jgi:hypothetical protein
MAAAINNGQSAARGPSQLATATAGVGTTAPGDATTTLTGGTDGATTITSTVLIGADTTPRTGMYALRNTGLWPLVVPATATPRPAGRPLLAFAKSELCQGIAVSPAGDTISNFATANTNDDPWLKVIFGDWVTTSSTA